MNFEGLDPVMKNAVASELGFKNAADALAVMHSQLDATGKVAADTIALVAKAPENTGEALKEELRRSSAIDMLRAMKPEEQFKSAQAIKDLAAGTEELAIAIETFNNRLIKTSSEVAPVMVAAGKEVSVAFAGGLEQASAIIAKLQEGTTDFFESGGFVQIIDNFKTTLAKLNQIIDMSDLIPHSMPKAWARILYGVDLFKDEFNKSFVDVHNRLSDNLESISKVAEVKGYIRPLEIKIIETDFDKTFDKMHDALFGNLDKMPKVTDIGFRKWAKGHVLLPEIESKPAADTFSVTAKPPTASVQPPPPAPTPSPAPVASTSAGRPLPATAETTDMKIKVHVEFDNNKMNELIVAHVQDIITGQINFNSPVGQKYTPGPYRIVFEQAGK